MEQSLYDTEELSLLSGDFLDVLDWSVAKEQQFLSQDGLKEKTTTYVPETGGDYTNLRSLGQPFYDPVDNWLDTKVDLLDLFNEGGDNMSEYLGESSAQQSLVLQTAQPDVATLVNELVRSEGTPESPVMTQLSEHGDDTGLTNQNGDQMIEGSKELLALLTQGLDESVFTGLKDEPILPPMSPEDIESILSSEPCSPTQPASPLIQQVSPTIEKPVEQHSAPGHVKTMASPSKRSAPYSVSQSKSKSNIVDRKARKRQQNRDAALRYRLKKRAEGAEIMDECEELESKNKELRDNIEQMTREIQYLKDLMAEVFKARKKK